MQNKLFFTSINDICKKCGGYRFAPYNSNTSATVRLCHCTQISKEELIMKAMKTVFFNDPPGDRSSSHKIDDDEV
jgi:hypothetical protein